MAPCTTLWFDSQLDPCNIIPSFSTVNVTRVNATKVPKPGYEYYTMVMKSRFSDTNLKLGSAMFGGNQHAWSCQINPGKYLEM